MKPRKILYILFLLLPLILTLAALPFLPDTIPAHYNFQGQVDRWGSKYETLVFPALNLSVGLIMLLTARLTARDEKDGENNYKICILAGFLSMGFFTAMTVFFLCLDFAQAETMTSLPMELNSLIWAGLGVMQILLGNVMPKARRNSLLGLRTAWSQSSEEAWKKSQRFGGILSIAAGIAMIAFSFLLKGMTCMYVCLGLLAVEVAADVVYSYFAAKSS